MTVFYKRIFPRNIRSHALNTETLFKNLVPNPCRTPQ